ncbi:MAG TPA: T9SS type A sorting domain-containing protein [Flavobacteriales bacterium]|nr:T9SS type A sorting domain-containing protein [Flavobacteriales bacterium]
MQRIIAYLFVSFGSFSIAQAQNCLPQGITLNQQWEVNAFPNNYPGCTQIQGYLKIGPSNDASAGGITDLTPLSQITSVGGYLMVEATLGLEELTGLDNLTSVGGYAKFNMNDYLSDISALSNLTTVGGYLEVRLNPVLSSLTGLGSVTSTGGNLVVHLNSSLTDLQGLEGLVDIGGGCSIENNPSLVSMNGLAPSSVGVAFWVKGNPLLTDLSAASGLTSIGGWLNLQDNASLPSLQELSGVTALGGYLRVQNCPLITDLSPLQNIDPTTITQLLFQDLPGVSDCALENICTYLGLPNAQPTIANNAAGCASVAEVEAACSSVGMDDIVSSAGTLRLFPNPARELITIELSDPGMRYYRILDVMGREVMSRALANDGGPIRMLDVAALPQGTYLLEVGGTNGSAMSRFIKE